MKKKNIVLSLFLLMITFNAYTLQQVNNRTDSHTSTNGQSMQAFRNQVISWTRQYAEQSLAGTLNPDAKNPSFNQYEVQYAHNYWSVTVSIYGNGHELTKAYSTQSTLSKALAQATNQAVQQLPESERNSEQLKNYRFQVSFDYPPDNHFTIIEFQQQGLELLGNRIAQRMLNKPSISQQLHNSEHYLLGAMNPQYHGFMKLYTASADKKEATLRTIYSASSLLTLIKLYEYTHDEALVQYFKPIAQFLLSQQLTEGENKGAFYYSFNPNTKKQRCHIETGTASKTIFTLIRLYTITQDKTYLDAATRAGDWLVSKIKADGSIVHSGYCKGEQWTYNDKPSFLYSGQMLSALSRLYLLTKNPAYLAGADKIAHFLMEKAEKQHGYVGDAYRHPNSVSTSWVTMSLIDYAKIKQNPAVLHLISETANAFVQKQINNPFDIYNHGRFLDSMTTSGNGWMNEVMGELYPFCQQQHLPHCERYANAMILSSRWLMQNAYTQENSYNLPDPKQALGGFIRNYISEEVRTDAVCHGTNSLISLMAIVKDKHDPLILVPERPAEEILGLLRIGKANAK